MCDTISINKKIHTINPKFYGIGVGPGDSMLITKQAESIIKQVDILILPAKDKDNCKAYNIVKDVIPEINMKECVFMPFPMSMKEPELSTFHREVADCVEENLKNGKSVGFLSIGDVSIYSTFVYVERIVAGDGFATEYIAGIPSFIAAASTLSTYLVLGNEQLHIIPGNEDIDEALKLKGTIVFMKSGRKLKELKSRLQELNADGQYEVKAVSNCGLANEYIAIGEDNISEESGYLTVVIVKKL